MLRRFGFLLAFLLFSTAPVFAQGNYCDTNPPTAGTAVTGAAITLQVCTTGKDANGNTVLITGWAVYDNGVRTTPTLTKGSTSSISGLTLYTLALTAPASASVHTYQTAAINAQGEGAKGNPFVLTVNLPLTVPDAPVKLSVQ